MSYQHFWTIFLFIFLPDFFSKIPVTKSNILRRDWKKFESSKFISDFNQITWEQILCNEENDVNFSMNKYLSKTDSLLDAHAPFKKLNKKELKFSPNRVSHKVCKTLLKRKTSSNQNL